MGDFDCCENGSHGHEPMTKGEVVNGNEELIAEARKRIALATEYGIPLHVVDLDVFADLADALEALTPREVQTVEVEWGVRHSQGTRACRDRGEAEERLASEIAYDDRRQRAYRGMAAIVTRRPAGPWHPLTPTSTQGEER